MPSINDIKPNIQPIADLKIEKKMVIDKITNLKRTSAPGPDKINASTLQDLKEVIADPLVSIMRKSYNTGIVPTQWKSASVIPIFKKGSKHDPGNYRPISLTSINCKLMESLIKDSIVDFLLVIN